MFDMQMPWWEFILRAALVYLALMIMLRVSGKRTISEYTPFDLLVVVLIGESLSGSMAGSDESLPGGLLLAATLLGMNVLVAYIASRSIKAEKIIEGSPVLLGRNGEWFDDVAKKQRIGNSELKSALREADCELEDMEYAILEANGVIAIKTKKGA